MNSLPLRLGLQQRVIPSYRVAFFDSLAKACALGMSVFAGQPRPSENILTSTGLNSAVYYPGINHHLLGGPFYLCWQSNLLTWLESWQPDVLIVEANPRYLRTPAAVRWMHARRRPVIGWGLGAPAAHGVFAGLRMGARRAFLSQFDALLVYSRQGAQQYIDCGIDPQRIFVAPNAAAPRPTQTIPLRTERSAPAVVLSVGRLQARKRVDLLIRACAAMPAALRPQLWIVGEGPAQKDLEALARQVYPQARFFGAVHGPELNPLFLQADLFVLPGTGGLAVQQAMASALPVIVAEGDGTQSDLVGPFNGWTVPRADLSALTAALSAALSDLPALRRMGLESFRIVAEEVNVERMVQEFCKAIRWVRGETEKVKRET